MQQPTVLIGFAEAMAAPETLWSLVDAGFSVIAFARKGRASALRHSRHVVCHEICAPESDLNAALADLQSLLISVGVQTNGAQPVLFPLDDRAVWLCSQLPSVSGQVLAGPKGMCADLALNKSLQVGMAREAGFNVPQTALVRTAEELLDFCSSAEFPIVLKAVECVSKYQGRVYSCPHWICANQRELDRAIGEWGERAPLLAQNYITGVGEGVFGIATSGGVRAWSGHRRLRMMNPRGSGSSACTSQLVPQDLRSIVETFLGRAGWRGLFMIELLRDSAGKLWFIELNGRPWGSMALSRCQGLEYPAWNVKLALDENSPVDMAQSPPAGVVCRHLGRELMHVLFVLRGAKSKAQDNWPSLWKTIREVMCLHRGDGFYNWRRDDAKVFLADCYYTIHDNLFKATS